MKKFYILLIIAIFTINSTNAQQQPTSLDSKIVPSIIISGNNIYEGTLKGEANRNNKDLELFGLNY